VLILSTTVVLPLTQSSRNRGSLVVRFIVQENDEAAAVALGVAEAAIGASDLPFSTEIADSARTATADAMVNTLDAIVSKLDSFIKIIDKTSKVEENQYLTITLFNFICSRSIHMLILHGL
jgi:hypothetical protein